MLIRHNGASISTWAKILRRPSSLITASFSSILSLITGSKKSLVTLLANVPSRMARTSSPSRIKIWQPAHGIVFGNSPPSSSLASARVLSMVASVEGDREITLLSENEDSYALAKSAELPSSDSDFSSRASLGKSDLSSDNRTSSDASMTRNSGGVGNGSEIDEGEQQKEAEDGEELHIPLAFHISKNVFQQAKNAAPGTKESFWSYKLYVGPENQEVKVHYCKAKHTTERVAQYFVGEKVIGLDIEWKPDSTRNSGIKNNVSLIQIASEKRIGLFHIAAFPKNTVDDLVAPTLKKILENPEITKVGIAIKGDCTRLRNFLQIEPRGIFELSHLYKLVRYSLSGEIAQVNKRLVSLATQAEEHLGLPIFKGEVRGSDWTQPLAIEQIIYAASDAYANLMLFDVLELKRKQLKPIPPRPYHAELNLPIRLALGATISANDETLEEIEPKAIPTARSSKPASAAEAAAENIQIEEDAEPGPVFSKLNTSLTPKSIEHKTPSLPLQKCQELIDAEKWAVNYHNVNSMEQSVTLPNTVSFAMLRVYALWNMHPEFTIVEIAAMLRKPPLRTSTVANYILESVRVKKLPYEKERLKAVLRLIPDSRNMWRYKGLWKTVE